MTAPERPINTFYAFCSLVVPGLGQLLQKRPGAAIGFFAFFILTGFPALMSFDLLVTWYSPDPPMVARYHSLFLPCSFSLPLILLIFYAVLDAAVWQRGEHIRFKNSLTALAIVYFCVFVPAFGYICMWEARVPNRLAHCANNMKQIALAFHMYYDKHGHLPPAYSVDENGKPLHSWRVLILPFMEQKVLYAQIRLDEPWDSEYNRQFHTFYIHEFFCPSYPRNAVPVKGAAFYSVIYGAKRTLSGSQIVLVERCTPVNWMNPLSDITFETACKGINVDVMGISSYHTGGANVALGDGSIRFISDTIDNEKLRAMLVGDAESH